MQRFVPHFLHSPYSTGDFDIRKSAIARTEPLLAISHFVSHATVVFFEETDPQGDAVQSRAVSGLAVRVWMISGLSGMTSSIWSATASRWSGGEGRSSSARSTASTWSKLKTALTNGVHGATSFFPVCYACRESSSGGAPFPVNDRCFGKDRRLTPHSGIDKVPRCSVRPENQFSFTRAALNTDGRAKINFLSV